MALPNLSGSNIQDTFQRVLHTDGSLLYNGTGSIIDVLNVTASHAVVETTKEISSSYAETASLGINFTAQGDFFNVRTPLTSSHRMFITASVANDAKLLLDDSGGNPSVNFRRGGTQKGVTGYYATGDQLKFVYSTTLNSNNGISMDSAGRVGIGMAPNTGYHLITANGIRSNAAVEGLTLKSLHEEPSIENFSFGSFNGNRGFYFGTDDNSRLITFAGTVPGEGSVEDNLVVIDYQGSITSSRDIVTSTGNIAGGLLAANANNLHLYGTPSNQIISASKALVIGSLETQISADTLYAVQTGTKPLLYIRGTNADTPALRVDGMITASGHISSSGTVFGNRIYQSGANIASIYAPIDTVNGVDSIVTVGALSAGSITNGFDDINFTGKVITTNTGSFGYISSSGNISSSGTVTAAGLSIPAGDASFGNGSLVLGNASTNVTLKSTGNITASGDISASGTIYASQYAVDGYLALDSNSTTGRVFSGQSSTAIEIGRTGGTNKNISLFGPVTASGDISASGVITGESLVVDGQISSSGNSAVYAFQGHFDNQITVGGANINTLYGDARLAETQTFTGQKTFDAPITASVISASGNIYGRQFEQITQNFTSTITTSNTETIDGVNFGTVYLPWTDNDTENASVGNKFVNKVAAVPGRPVRTIVRAILNWELAGGSGDKEPRSYTASFHTQKSFESAANTVDRMSVYVDSRQLGSSLDAREHLVFDWRNPDSGSVGDCDVGDKLWMTLRSNNEEATNYMVTTIFEWDYGGL